ncbi:AraC family transcriptional regulator [Janthinobacterium sp. RB2R34]|uniref:AraC family transcriptional regulator n=1 Tax=Janthinobacterium sp. RB2R34 TaxID=3424193 RepID=UPI003F206402
MPNPDPLETRLRHAITMADGEPHLIAVTASESVARESVPHSHLPGQLLGLFSGLLTVRTDAGNWTIPTTHAVWLPSSVTHAARSHGPFSGWAVYVAPPYCAGLPLQPCAIKVSGLLREAVLRAAQWPVASGVPLERTRARIAQVLLDEIAAAPVDALGLPLPREARLLRIASALIDDPADARTLDQWAHWASLAPRTLSRRFAQETGMNLTTWRQRLRLLRALELLAGGQSVTAVAIDLGYDSVSAFIALFRRTFGTTPGRYFAARLAPG